MISGRRKGQSLNCKVSGKYLLNLAGKSEIESSFSERVDECSYPGTTEYLRYLTPSQLTYTGKVNTNIFSDAALQKNCKTYFYLFFFQFCQNIYRVRRKIGFATQEKILLKCLAPLFQSNLAY